MIQKKTIKKGEEGLLSELYYIPKMRCCLCGEENYGKGILKISIVTQKEVNIGAQNREISRICIPTDTDAEYRLSLYNIDIIPTIGYINKRYSEEAELEMVDMEEPISKISKDFRNSSMYNHLKYQTLYEFIDGDSSLTKCAQCGCSDWTEPGYEIQMSTSAPDYSILAYKREGYSTDSEMGCTLNNVSILIQHIDGDDLITPIESKEGFLYEDNSKESFQRFIELEAQHQVDMEW